jgi:hypothetical protein
MSYKAIVLTGFFAALFSFSLAGSAFANLDQVKLYQSVFGGDKPKCLTCHVDKIPKKADGQHEWNDYGKKLKAAKETLSAEVYKKVGKNERAVY